MMNICILIRQLHLIQLTSYPFILLIQMDFHLDCVSCHIFLHVQYNKLPIVLYCSQTSYAYLVFSFHINLLAAQTTCKFILKTFATLWYSMDWLNGPLMLSLFCCLLHLKLNFHFKWCYNLFEINLKAAQRNKSNTLPFIILDWMIVRSTGINCILKSNKMNKSKHIYKHTHTHTHTLKHIHFAIERVYNKKNPMKYSLKSDHVICFFLFFMF